MGQLVPSDRDEIAVAEEDVGGLVDRIGQEQPAQGAFAGCLRFGLHRRVATQLCDRDQAQERQHQLIERGHRTVRKHGRGRGVDASCEIVQQQFTDIAGQVPDTVAVGDHLVVGDDHEDLHPSALKSNTVREGAEVVAQMQCARGPVAGEDAEAFGVLGDLVFEMRTARGQAEGSGCGVDHDAPRC